MVEGANVSGAGTETPFEVREHPGLMLLDWPIILMTVSSPVCNVKAVDFKPISSNYGKRLCHGVSDNTYRPHDSRSRLPWNRNRSALYRLYPNDFKLDATLGLIGARWIIEAMREGQDPQSIAIEWINLSISVLVKRAKYLLY